MNAAKPPYWEKTLFRFVVSLSILAILGLIMWWNLPRPNPTWKCPPPESVFSAEEMRQRVTCHPDAYKILVEDDVAVLFAFPAGTIDWAGSAFVIHIPSVSEVVLDSQSQIIFTDYKSDLAQVEIEEVLQNPELMAQIDERLAELRALP